jgi:hypothetical protein
MTICEKFAAGNDEIMPIRLIDFDASLIAEYLARRVPIRQYRLKTQQCDHSPGRKPNWLMKP